MLPTTSSLLLPQEHIITNLHYPRRLLLLHAPFYHPPPPPPTPNYQLHPSPHGGFDANLVMIVSVLLSALICSLCVNSIIRCVLKCSSLINREPNYNINMINNQEVVVTRGVDKRALRTFPIVKYSKEVKIEGLLGLGLDTECVICLSEFNRGERVRILPKCNHGFHVKCIDKWLNSHSSCPTCRQSLSDTCQKIIGCDDHHDQACSSSSPMAVKGEMIAISIVPLQREDLVRNFRG